MPYLFLSFCLSRIGHILSVRSLSRQIFFFFTFFLPMPYPKNLLRTHCIVQRFLPAVKAVSSNSFSFFHRKGQSILGCLFGNPHWNNLESIHRKRDALPLSVSKKAVNQFPRSSMSKRGWQKESHKLLLFHPQTASIGYRRNSPFPFVCFGFPFP